MKTLLCILDGLGISQDTTNNLCIPFIQNHLDNCVLLNASAEYVGLNKGQMGNSEVGHMTIGSGRIIKQYLVKINDSISTDTFPDIIQNPSETYHLIGLLSDGGVHSHIDHILYLIRALKASNAKKIYLHIITDGRDTPPKSVEKYIKKLMPLIDDKCEIATICGRYYAMDRDNRVDRTQAAYDAIASGQSDNLFGSIIDFISHNYNNNITDEFFYPGCNVQYTGIQENDVVVFCNFRSDRMKQISRMIFEKLNHVKIFSMVDYFDGQITAIHPIFQNKIISNTLGEVLSRNGKKQLRISETEKYAHVTFFFNCGNEKPYANEDRILIPSPKVSTYDLQPEMSAYEITERLIHEVQTKKYDFICVNFANADMVGHTGNISAAEKACAVLDECLNTINRAALDNDYILLITADHGNIEKMFDDETKQPHTAHTLNKVPLICISDVAKKSYDNALEYGLRDVAPTILNMMNIEIPDEMSGKPLFKIIND